MNLKQLAAQPQLKRITLDDPDIIRVYGESLDFWIWDRQPLAVFMDLARDLSQEPQRVVELLSDIILDSEGNRIINGDLRLPTGVLVKAFAAIIQTLGE